MKKEYTYIFIFARKGEPGIMKTLTVRSSEKQEDISRRADKAAIGLRDKLYPDHEVYVTCGKVVQIQIS
jgi:hypothetical protein